METIIAMILAAIAVGFVGYPLLKANPEEVAEPPVEEETVEEELVAQKEAVYEAISELNFDHAMGNLSDQDHDELRERYKLKALNLMKQIDEVEQAKAAQPFGGRTQPPERRTTAASRRTRDGGGSSAFCSGCGARLSPDDRFCAKCGQPLTSGCPNCGADSDPEDVYCASCGQRL